MQSEREREVVLSCSTLCDPMDCSLPGSSVHGNFQERVLEWVAISISRGSSQARDRIQICTAGRRFAIWATRKSLCTEYIMWNAGLDEAQAGINIVGRKVNNLRYADDSTLMAASEEEFKSLLMKVKMESGKIGLKLNIQKTKFMAPVPLLHGK